MARITAHPCEAVFKQAALAKALGGAAGGMPQNPTARLELLLVHTGERVEVILHEPEKR